MKHVDERCDDWDEHIDAVLFGYRVTYQSSVKFTPYELMFGCKVRLPIELDTTAIKYDSVWNEASYMYDALQSRLQEVQVSESACVNALLETSMCFIPTEFFARPTHKRNS